MEILNNIRKGLHNCKVNFINTSIPGRMIRFDEGFGTAFINTWKTQVAEVGTYLGNYTTLGRAITKDESLATSFKVANGLEKGEINPVESSVPRLNYEM